MRDGLTEGSKHLSFSGIWTKVRSLRPRLQSLQFQLIIPYLVLTLALAAIGTFVITVLVVDSEQERFNNRMIESSRVANDGIVGYEKQQLERLRFLVFAEGMAQAMYDKNSEEILRLMQPVMRNSNISLITAIDLNGKEIVSFGKTPDEKNYRRQQGVDFSGVSIVPKVLQGVTDGTGDKFSEVVRLEQGPILFTAARVIDQNEKLVGAMLVGTYLKDILADLETRTAADIILLDTGNNLIASTMTGQEEGFLNLIGVALNTPPDDKTKPVEVEINQRQYQVAYSDFTIRNEPVGRMGVIRNSDYLVNQAQTTRNLFAILFTAGTLAVILIGYLLARGIVTPVLKLRNMSQAVAGGDLDQQIQLNRNDEIGELAGAFDTMTLHLKERTEEAARLYDETLQRNKELAEINAKLEATQIQLVQSEKLASIGQLTAGIVHDVKNPFAVIMGMSEVLAEDENLDEATRHGLKVIRESAVKGNTIVSDLLKFARQSKSELRSMDIRETVQSSIRLTAYLTRKYNTSFEIPEQPVMVSYDAQQVEQVLINMIHNAVQAMPGQGILRIALTQVDGNAQIAIQDSGSGISPEHLKRIFDPFFTTKPEGEGTGLGLSVSYGIIANHRGRIDVESEMGKGTTFTIVLPVTQPS